VSTARENDFSRKEKRNMEKVGNIYIRKDLVSTIEYLSYEKTKNGNYGINVKMEGNKRSIQCMVTTDPHKDLKDILGHITPHLDVKGAK
jgi:hypothetical protein